MSEENEVKQVRVVRSRPHRGESLLFPLLLISAGLAFLVDNLGLVDDLSWGAALRLWPLLLIFIGLDIIVRQAGRPLGTLLSGLLGIVASVLLGLLLIFGQEVALPAGISPELKRETVSYPVEGVSAAEVTIDLSSFATDIDALDDSPDLIAGEMVYADRLIFDARTEDSVATIDLGVSEDRAFFNPFGWFNQSTDRWQIGLSPAVPLDLRIDGGSGAADIDLRRLVLTGLNLDGGSGSLDIWLPVDAAEVQYAGGSGSASIRLPESGEHRIEADTASGSVQITFPAGMEIRLVVVDKGSGSISFDRDLFEEIEAEDDGEGVWETAGYGDSANQTEIILDTGSGSVRIGRG